MSQDLVPFWANAGPSELSWGIFQSTAGINAQESKSRPQCTTSQYQGLQCGVCYKQLIFFAFCYGNNLTRAGTKRRKTDREYGLKCRVLKYPGYSRQKKSCQQGSPSQASAPAIVIHICIYFLSHLAGGAASECCTVVTGGDNPTDFLQDIMGNEVFIAWPTLLREECARVRRRAGWGGSASD